MKHTILMPNWVGDLILALSVIERKCESSKDEFILIVPNKLVDLTKQLTNLQIIAYKRANKNEFLESINNVKSVNADSICVLAPSFSSAWFAFKTGIKRRRGLSSDLRSILLTERLPVSVRNKNLHITKEYATILEAQFADPETWGGKIIKISEEHRDAVIFCPGANYGTAKKWQNFSKLAKLFENEKIIVLGGSDAKNDGDNIEKSGGKNILNLTEKTTLENVANIIAGAKIVISNDSGLMHLAGYLGKPLVGIFGSTSPTWTKPIGGYVKIAHKNILCSPCFKRECRYGHYECLKNISAEEVKLLADSLLDN